MAHSLQQSGTVPWGLAPGSKTLFVDGNRTDSYTAIGSAQLPFKTISAAVAQVVTNGDNSASIPYCIQVSAGTYVETVDLGNSLLSTLWIIGDGAIISPSSGNALQCLANNQNLATCVFRGLTFDGSVSFTDAVSSGTLASNLIAFENCVFTANANASFTRAAGTSFGTYYFLSCLAHGTVNTWTFDSVYDAFFVGCIFYSQSVTGTLTVSRTNAVNANTVYFVGCHMYFDNITLSGQTQLVVTGSVFQQNGTCTLNGGTLFMYQGANRRSTGALTINSGATLTMRGGLLRTVPVISGGTLSFDGSSYVATAIATTHQNQSSNGAQWIAGQASELLTLSTTGLTTDTTGSLLPANAVIDSVVVRVTTTITTTTNWAVGDANISSRFSSANATLVAGTTSVGLNHVDQTGTSGPKQVAAAKVRITCTGSNPGAGVVRITVFYRQFVAPTS